MRGRASVGLPGTHPVSLAAEPSASRTVPGTGQGQKNCLQLTTGAVLFSDAPPSAPTHTRHRLERTLGALGSLGNLPVSAGEAEAKVELKCTSYLKISGRAGPAPEAAVHGACSAFGLSLLSRCRAGGRRAGPGGGSWRPISPLLPAPPTPLSLQAGYAASLGLQTPFGVWKMSMMMTGSASTGCCEG